MSVVFRGDRRATDGCKVSFRTTKSQWKVYKYAQILYGTSGVHQGWFFLERKPIMSKRELIEPHQGDKRYVRRDTEGKFNESVDVGRSLAADERQHAKTVAKSGEGDRGDHKRN